MIVNPPSAVQSHVPVRDHEPHSKAKAHGLVRQLQEDTFNGASAEKHRARFAHRLTESPPAADVDASASNALPGDVATDDSPADTDEVAPAIIDEAGSSSDTVTAEISYDVIPASESGSESTSAREWYGYANVLFPFSGSGQQFDWTV